jgi:hypothetical protein
MTHRGSYAAGAGQLGSIKDIVAHATRCLVHGLRLRARFQMQLP